MPTAQKVFSGLFAKLNDRQQEVLAGRFGLEKSGKKLTLAALGNRYGVTRERVRQIETTGLAALREHIEADPAGTAVLAASRKYLKEQGGVAPREALLAEARAALPGITQNHMSLIAEATKAFAEHQGDKDFHPFYYLTKEDFKSAAAFVKDWAQHLRSRKGDVLSGKYQAYFADFVKKQSVPSAHAENYLAVSKRVGKNPYGDRGLTEWAEVNPRTVRDRIYLVMMKQGEPIHFRTIAKLINDAKFSSRLASAPTVHNELIKDKRFVLVGRGTYALAENGYEPGTAREVIHRILRKNGPLRPKDIMLAVQKERLFKENTILVNLQNKSHFLRRSDGTYKVREA
jgi:hypothetical protein